MKIKSLFALAVFGWLAGGCASPNVNPAHARPDTGYVDFYADDADGLWWDITDVKRNQRVFYKISPVKGSILRLAFKPGQYQLRVTFLNHAVIKPGVADVEVHDGMVTPVTVTLLPAGTVLVETRTGAGGRNLLRTLWPAHKNQQQRGRQLRGQRRTATAGAFPAPGADVLRRCAERVKARAGNNGSELSLN